ncbi:MAG: endonuclease/exonuclease/phosphatase family protein [Xanthomonadaceae bacterium]|nr:endonuclease/exonuclease/phosphatase family protein [Xanthomonadaceae bacterium]
MGIIQTIAATLFALALLLVWAMGGWHTPKSWKEQFTEANPPAPRTLTVISFNTSWFYGMGSEGPGYKPVSEEHFLERIRESANWIKSRSADLVFMQEVDFHASRSHGVNQLREFSKLSGLTYQAEAISWNVNYLPFPYSPTLQWGKIISGGAVLSRTPIKEQTVSLLKKPDANFFLYNQFYLFRYLQVVDLGFGLAVNLHLEAFDSVNREEHFRELKQWITKNADRIWIVGGDFNTSKFEGLNLSPLKRDEDSEPTFPSSGAKERLDHIWYNPKHLKPIKHEVGSSLKASDHHPISSQFLILK